MPPNPPSNTHGFTMRSISLHDMQIPKSIKKFLGPPPKSWGRPCNHIINPNKTTCTLFTPDPAADPAEYNSNLGLNINNKALPMALHPKVLGLTLDPKLTYNAHIQNIATHAQKPLQVIKALTGTTWGKQTLEYASSMWSPMASPTSINKLQVMQNAALRACTGCTHDPNIYNICMTKPTSFPYRNIYNCMHRKSDKKHNTHHIHYTDTLHITIYNGL